MHTQSKQYLGIATEYYRLPHIFVDTLGVKSKIHQVALYGSLTSFIKLQFLPVIFTWPKWSSEGLRTEQNLSTDTRLQHSSTGIVQLPHHKYVLASTSALTFSRDHVQYMINRKLYQDVFCFFNLLSAEVQICKQMFLVQQRFHVLSVHSRTTITTFLLNI